MYRKRSTLPGCGVRMLNLGGEMIDTRSATGGLILTIFAGFAQFEREIMLERQREGIRKAQAAGKEAQRLVKGRRGRRRDQGRREYCLHGAGAG